MDDKSEEKQVGQKLPRSMILRGRRAFDDVRQRGNRIRIGGLLLFFCQEGATDLR